MNFGTGFLVDNRPRPEFHDEHDANHHPDFDFKKIEVGGSWNHHFQRELYR